MEMEEGIVRNRGIVILQTAGEVQFPVNDLTRQDADALLHHEMS